MSCGPTSAACLKSPRDAGALAYLLSDSAFFKDIADRASQLRLKGKAGSPLSEYLWDSTSSQIEEARNSKYIKGLELGNLDPTYFGAFMVQDSVYCYRAKQSIDTAKEKATDPIVKEFLQKRSESYNKYYQELFQTWRIQDANGIKLSQACADYVAVEKNVAETKSAVYLIVALIPCARLWPWLGQQISASTHSFGVYESWVNANLDPTDQGYKKYETIIDDAFLVGDIDPAEALSVYKDCMTGEANFFNFV